MTNCFRNGMLPDLPDDEPHVEQESRLEPNLAEVSSDGPTLATQDYAEDHPGFQVYLGTSRVYRRTENYESDVSFTSSALRTHAWSVFSGLSLAEVSVISAIALPLYLDEIYNQEWYTLKETEQNIPEQTWNAINISPPVVGPTDMSYNADPFRATQMNAAKSIMLGILGRQPAPLLLSSSNKPARKVPYQGIARNGTGKMVLHKLVALGDGGVGRTELVTQVRFV